MREITRKCHAVYRVSILLLLDAFSPISAALHSREPCLVFPLHGGHWRFHGPGLAYLVLAERTWLGGRAGIGALAVLMNNATG